VAIVVDSSILVVLASGDPRRPLAQAVLRQWATDSEDLHAPALLPYEVANGLTRLVAAGAFPADQLPQAWQTVTAVSITYHELREHGLEVIRIARRLGRASAYDAAYLALADQLGAELWTFDGPLARNAAGHGFPVYLVQ
jgi:predicted nucleic acid-binding protein